jgi:serine/threonine protein kinase
MMACSGYWPPEYIKHQIISKEFDIFSLGVIIVKIMTGHDGYNRVADMTTRKFVEHVRTYFFSIHQFQPSLFNLFDVIFNFLWYIILNVFLILEVHENWRKKLCRTSSHATLEVLCNQVKTCIELALVCLKSNRQERPTIQDIVSSLKETDTMIGHRGLQIEQVPSCDTYVYYKLCYMLLQCTL